MNFDVYCDESRPDALCSKVYQGSSLVIGSLWLARDDRESIKESIHTLRDRHKVGGEFKWAKVSPSRAAFYENLVELFFSEGNRLRFRCIVVDRKKVDLLNFHGNDQELGFYKFYYQLLLHWIKDSNNYRVFCDYKLNRDMSRLQVLQRCLKYANLTAQIEEVQAVKSEESVLIQLTDVLTGAVAARMNRAPAAGSAKAAVVSSIESRLNRAIGATALGEQKFNVFAINPGGGW